MAARLTPDRSLRLVSMDAEGTGGGEGEPERRLKKAMDKLYHFPKPRPSGSPFRGLMSGERARPGGLKVAFGVERVSRIPKAAEFAAIDALGPPPPCRPWDRRDLMRRLATFKAMTWFAKPKVISPANCARRGWINTEVDFIACEACGTRLMFMTPCSWTPQQVEKAAAVFSLKLDNGHKLLCPWIDNVCDESLALFPPTPPPLLIENYKDYFASLMRLAALPRVSPVALEYMKDRCPQVEQFLLQPVSSSAVVNGVITLIDYAQNEDTTSALEDSAAYYQALKMISLCGWEPHLLPYAVDSKPKATASSTLSNQSQSQNESRVEVYSTDEHRTDTERTVYTAQHDSYRDPASVVLDCQFCRARVALWAFSMLERPLQHFKMITTAPNPDEPENWNAEPSRVTNFGLNQTIAGGPSAAHQNFRPKVSFPVVSRHLNHELSSSVSSARYDGGQLKRKRSSNDGFSSDSAQVPDDCALEIQNQSNQEALLVENSEVTGTKEFGESLSVLIGHNAENNDDESVPGMDSLDKDALVASVAPLDGKQGERGGYESDHLSSASVCRETSGNQSSGKTGLYASLNDFDPIKQHHTFCPWIAPDDGKASPGWELTLLALLSQEKASNADSKVEIQTPLLDEIDDPITSVRKLFMSPLAKRAKGLQ